MAAAYKVTELPPLNNLPASGATSINQSGAIVGYSNNPEDDNQNFWIHKHATSWSGGKPAAPPAGIALNSGIDPYAAPAAINDVGVVVGGTTIWTAAAQDYVHPIGAHDFYTITDINNAGWITGQAGAPGIKAYMWRYSNGEYPLDLLQINEIGNAINNNDIVVGSQAGKAVLWNYFLEHPAYHLLKDGGNNSAANDINDHDVIVGYIKKDANGDQRPVQWLNYSSEPVFLDTSFPIGRSEATAINNRGQIVGFYVSANDGNQFNAFVCNTQLRQSITGPDGIPILLPPVTPTIVDLNVLIDPATGWHLEYANDINDRGQIVGEGTLNGLRRGFRLDPVIDVTSLLHQLIPIAHSNIITREVLNIIVGLIGGNDGWILTPNGLIHVPGNQPDVTVSSLLDIRIQFLIQQFINLTNIPHASYESRKRMVEKIEEFIAVMYNNAREKNNYQ